MQEEILTYLYRFALEPGRCFLRYQREWCRPSRVALTPQP